MAAGLAFFLNLVLPCYLGLTAVDKADIKRDLIRLRFASVCEVNSLYSCKVRGRGIADFKYEISPQM